MTDTWQSYLDNKLRIGRETGCFPCAAAAVGAGDTLLAMAFTGGAPLPDDPLPDEDTLFDIASLSKVVGPTMIALRALEEGTLRLDETVGDFIPEAPEDKRDITIKQLMTHTAGFHPSFRLDRMGITPEETMDCILREPLPDRPGGKPVYSCMGYILLGKLLEKRFGQPLRGLAEERVFRPLGMMHTAYSPVTGRCAATEVDPETGRPWIGIVHDENSRFQGGNSGNAGIFMPLKDGIRFMSMLGQMGGTYLKRRTMELAITNYTPGCEWHRGLGFHMAGTPNSLFSGRVPPATFGHTGFTGTSMMVEPSSGLWVLLLSNRVYPTRDSEALFPFRRQLHGDTWERYVRFGLENGGIGPIGQGGFHD